MCFWCVTPWILCERVVSIIPHVSQFFALVLSAYPVLYSSIRYFSPHVMTPLQSSQEAHSPLLLLSSSAPALAFYLSSTFTLLLHLSLFSAAHPLLVSLIHPCHGALVTWLVVAMATCIQAILCWNPWETPLHPCRSPEGRGGRGQSANSAPVIRHHTFSPNLQRVYQGSDTAANICF